MALTCFKSHHDLRFFKTILNFFQNHLRLLEVAQVPKDNIEDFKSVKKFNVFNTNNLWISLPAVRRVIEEGTLDMEVIVNPKVLEGGVNVIQLEVPKQNFGFVISKTYSNCLSRPMYLKKKLKPFHLYMVFHTVVCLSRLF